MNIAVYLGSSSGNEPALKQAVFELGKWIGSNGHVLVYGGSSRGLMGVLAEAVREYKGKVIGVLPRMYALPGIIREDLDETFITEDLAERRKKMIGLSDVFIAFPGGTGTLDEISEIMCMIGIGLIKAPCILYDLNGYYEGLKMQLQKMAETGLSSQEKISRYTFAKDLDQIISVIEEQEDK